MDVKVNEGTAVEVVVEEVVAALGVEGMIQTGQATAMTVSLPNLHPVALTLKSGFADVPAWLKSNMPGPSVVPAANDWPRAAAHVVPSFVPLGACTSRPPPKSAYVCTARTRPVSGAAWLAVARSAAETFAWRSAMMRDESYMSLPGPDAKQSSFLCIPRALGHVEWSVSHGSPCRGPPWHMAPRVLGETSPRLVAANAATNGPLPGRAASEVGPFCCRSTMYEAWPLLSPDKRWLVLLRRCRAQGTN